MKKKVVIICILVLLLITSVSSASIVNVETNKITINRGIDFEVTGLIT
jgi:hypothetical protein